VISGRVTDARARAVPNALVALLQPHPDRAEGALPAAGLIATTNNLGRYSIPNVPAGDFYVVVIPANAQFLPSGQPNRSGLGITYFPAAKTLGAARRIKVAGRAPVTANVTVGQAALLVVSGRATPADGRPPADATLEIATGGPLTGLRRFQTGLGRDGRFNLAGFAPGIYTLRVLPSPWPAPPDVQPKVSAATVTVTDSDLAVNVEPVKLVRLRGRATAEGEFVRGALTQSPVFINAEPASIDDAIGPRGEGLIHEDLSFEFLVWPGRLVFTASPSVWRVKSVRVKDREVADGLEARPGETISNLVIELTPD
jgi:hypothetical protein